jgi:hypothetical protein
MDGEQLRSGQKDISVSPAFKAAPGDQEQDGFVVPGGLGSVHKETEAVPV